MRRTATSAAVAWGANAVNLSWTRDGLASYEAQAKFYDQQSWDNYVSIIGTTGNTGSAGCGDDPIGAVLSPGNAYNVITVAHFDDKGTVSWVGPPADSMSPCAGYVNPSTTHGDLHKPDVVAPGTNITTTGLNNGFASVSGSSFAAPAVTGIVALMQQRSFYLEFYPSAVKAILAASAIHSVSGTDDGWGAVVAEWADGVTNGTAGSWNANTYNTCAEMPPEAQLASVYLYGGSTYRFTLSWMHFYNYASGSAQPSSDLDLRIRNPQGLSVTGAFGWDNVLEVVEYTVPSSGYYTVNAVKARCDAAPRQVAWAMMRK